MFMFISSACSAPLASVPVWARKFSSPEELITEFCRECRIVWKGNSTIVKLYYVHPFYVFDSPKPYSGPIFQV